MSTFKAHNGLILASAYTTYDDKPTLVTGGNDNTIVIWEVRDCAGPAAAARRSNNGSNTFTLLTGQANVVQI
jgi:di- and tripeptidase